MADKHPRFEDPEPSTPRDKKQKTTHEPSNNPPGESYRAAAEPSQSHVKRKSRRLEERKSDEVFQVKSSTSNASGLSVFSPQSNITTTLGTIDSPKQAEMATLTDPAAFDDYYHGLRSKPKLLARSNSAPWAIPLVLSTSGYEGKYSRDMKTAFGVTHHPLCEKLDHGLRDKIRGVLSTMNPCRWISVDYLRIGYDKVVLQNNPVVVLVTVEKDQVSRVEAQRIVNALSEECKRANLHDVEVEVKEGQRSTATDGFELFNPQPVPVPTQCPLIGASIGGSQDNPGLTGTLGGYVVVDGEVMGLTNHHVALGTSRLEAFPTTQEETTGVTYTVLQPSESDRDRQIEQLEFDREGVSTKGISPAASQIELSTINTELEQWNSWTPDKCVLGKVWRSSGVRASNGVKDRRFRLDWALIKLSSARFSDRDEIVNEIPPYSRWQRTTRVSYCKTVLKAVGKKTTSDLPHHLKRSLTLEEVLNNANKADQEDRNSVVWKFGRTSHFTYGNVSGILSDYHSSCGVISDELAITDPIKMNPEYIFSDVGDSGSLVWDSEGYIAGLLWGGKERDFVTYVTPIEYVLEDIRLLCNTKEVKLVVRKEEIKQ